MGIPFAMKAEIQQKQIQAAPAVERKRVEANAKA